MNRAQFRFLERLRVRWAEVDLQKIVFNAHYLMYFDTASAGYWRAMAVPYHDTMEVLQGDLFVRKATVEYLGSAHYDDSLDIGLRCERIGNSSITFRAAAFRAETLLVSGELVYVFADPGSQRAKPVPQALRQALLAFEAGESMLRLKLGSWAEVGALAHPLRQAVFVDEQQIPADLEWDDADQTALHAVAINRFDMPLATGRMVEPGAGVSKIGRMAVRRDMRGSGVGKGVLEALVRAARERHCTEVMLHAQASAVGFYRRAGFTARGEAFEEAGIAHQEMVLPG